MALFAAIGDRFIAKILKQVSSDYNLDFEEMKTRYCGKSSFDLMVPTKKLEVDLEEEPEITPVPEPTPKPKKKVEKKPKEDTSKKLMALSKMKKPELVAECEERGLDSEGTVAQLKERLKEARESETPVVAKPVKEKKKPAKKKKAAAPPPPPVTPLDEEVEEPRDEEEEEEEEEEPDSPGGIRAKMLREAKKMEEMGDEPEEEEEEDLQARLRKILAEAEEEEFEDEEA
jgi:hypothetical protein